ncbi:P-loop containing nucleoside triphosphate hydrolase protein [Flagelloscypha sp. PMI_526]|nr:P-loop containing nucleoside triphosphate hydrolase protein [Flagelloscypha sp. PMI_526]
MGPFTLLSRGGAKFNKKKFAKDVQLFNVGFYNSLSSLSISSSILSVQKSTTSKAKSSSTAPQSIPTELDFFKYAEGGPSKRRIESAAPTESPLKRRKIEEQDTPPAFRHRVKTTGNDVPDPIEDFEELSIRYDVQSKLLSNLSKHGFKKPTGVQAYGIPILLEGRDLAAISPTGTGKTLSYLLPLFAALGAPSAQKHDAGLGVRAVIIAPTRELAAQIHNECLKLAEGRKWRTVLFSKASANSMKDKDVQNKTDLLVSTPLRLVQSLKDDTLELDNVRHLIIDEADRMLDDEFLPQIEEIIAACTHADLQKAVFSATLPAGAEKLAMGMMTNPIRAVVGLKDTPLPHIVQSLTYTASDSMKLPTLVAYLNQAYNPPILVFTSTQPRAASLAEELTMHGIQNVESLHAGMTNKARDDTISRMRKGQCWVLVCTEVAGRGLDFKGVREVINFDFPRSVQSYIHRIGRTGRAGRDGKAITYFTDDDAPWLKSIANVLLQSGSSVSEWILKLPKPSKIKRKQMGKVKRAETVNTAREVAKRHAVKKREMIEGSKRRKIKDANRPEESSDSSGSE